MKRFLPFLFLLVLTACDYTSEAPTFRYPTPIPVIVSGTPIAVLVPTPAPTATPQPTPTPQARYFTQLGECHGGSTTSTVQVDLCSISVSGITSNNGWLLITVNLECGTLNCGNVVMRNSTTGIDFSDNLFHAMLLADNYYQGMYQLSTSRGNAGDTWIVQGLGVSSDTTTEHSFRVTAGAIGNLSDSWTFNLRASGVTSGATLFYAVNIERVNS